MSARTGTESAAIPTTRSDHPRRRSRDTGIRIRRAGEHTTPDLSPRRLRFRLRKQAPCTIRIDLQELIGIDGNIRICRARCSLVGTPVAPEKRADNSRGQYSKKIPRAACLIHG